MSESFEDLTHFICVDTETTGFSPSDDRIIEIGAVVVTNRKLPVDAHGDLLDDAFFQTYIDPEQDIPVGAVNVHGIDWATAQEASGGRNFKAVMPDLLAFLDRHPYPLVAHNAQFDVSMLNAELRRNGGPVLQRTVHDSLKEARARYPRARRHSLDALIRKFQLPERDVHGALGDARLLAQICLAMTQSNQTLNYDPSQPARRQGRPQAGDAIDALPDHWAKAVPVVRPTQDEQNTHRTFMRTWSPQP